MWLSLQFINIYCHPYEYVERIAFYTSWYHKVLEDINALRNYKNSMNKLIKKVASQ